MHIVCVTVQRAAGLTAPGGAEDNGGIIGGIMDFINGLKKL
jgi:hypothetical protein